MARQIEIALDFNVRAKREVLTDVRRLYNMWRDGALGGEKMPEDVHPDLPADSSTLVHFLTLGMCLNYQRNSYSLWESCAAAYSDNETRWIFEPSEVASMPLDDLRHSLLKHKVGLQPNKHTDNWYRVSKGIVDFGNGDMRSILSRQTFDVAKIREFIVAEKKSFPYLAGTKILNYWLFVLLQYTSLPIVNRAALSIAPDTHVMQASLRLGVIDPKVFSASDGQAVCAAKWCEVLSGSEFSPIDVHTPLWLWSRLGFPGIR